MNEPWNGYDRNPYHNPESCGLELVGTIEYSSDGYDFDTRAVWRVLADGRFVTGRDSGCSCPSPFENVRGLADLEPLDLDALEAEYQCAAHGGDVDSFNRATARGALRSIRRAVEAAHVA